MVDVGECMRGLVERRVIVASSEERLYILSGVVLRDQVV